MPSVLFRHILKGASSEALRLANANLPYDELSEEELALPPLLYAIFEGGGMKGIAYVGAIQRLEEEGLLRKLKSVSGSSAGGLIAGLVALGYDSNEIKALFESNDFKSFFDEKHDLNWWHPKKLLHNIQNIHRMLNDPQHGFTSGKKFQEMLEILIEEKIGKKDATFKDLHDYIENNPNSGLKELILTGTNLTLQTLETYSYERTPHMKLSEALRITSAFPGAFPATIRKRDNGILEVISDGGIACNFPLHVYNRREFLPPKVDFTDEGCNPCSIGFLIDSDTERQVKIWNYYDKNSKPTANVIKFFKQVIDAKGIDYQTPRQGPQIVQIKSLGVNTLDFNLTKEKKEALYQTGYEETGSWIKNYRHGAMYSRKQYLALEEKYAEKSFDFIKIKATDLEKALEILNYQITHTKKPTPKQVHRKEQIIKELAFISQRFQISFHKSTLTLIQDYLERIAINPNTSPTRQIPKLQIPKDSNFTRRASLKSLEALRKGIFQYCETFLSQLEGISSDYKDLLSYAEFEKLRLQNNLMCLKQFHRGISNLWLTYYSENPDNFDKDFKKERRTLLAYLTLHNISQSERQSFIESLSKLSSIFASAISDNEKELQVKCLLKEIEESIQEREISLETCHTLINDCRHKIKECISQKEHYRDLMERYRNYPIKNTLFHKINDLQSKLKQNLHKEYGFFTACLDKLSKLCHISDRFLPANLILIRKIKKLDEKLTTYKEYFTHHKNALRAESILIAIDKLETKIAQINTTLLSRGTKTKKNALIKNLQETKNEIDSIVQEINKIKPK